jgi:phage terminase large subunit-like protein
MDLALSTDDKGAFDHALVVWGDIKKTAKSSCAAAVALWMAFRTEWGSIKVVANDLKQAKSRSYFYLTRSLQLNPRTKAMIDRGDIKITRYTVYLNFNHTKIEAIPADPKGEAGGNDDMVLFTELWTYQHQTHKRLWVETVVPPNKWGKSFRWVESYAGFVGESEILENLYNENVKDKYRLDNTIAPLYENAGTFVMWNQTPRLPWLSKEYYAQQRTELSEAEFNRVHRNMWVGSTTTFVQPTWWDTLKVEDVKRDGRESVVVGCDAAYAQGGDYFVVVVVGKHPTDSDKYAVKEAKFWRANKNGNLDFEDPNDETNTDYPYGYVMDLAKRYRVLEVAYDPYQLHSMASKQTKKRVAFWKEFTQGKPRTVADTALFNAIRDGSLVHSGIPLLDEHVKNAGRDSKGRLVKLSKDKKIDGAVALSMANHRARYYRL